MKTIAQQLNIKKFPFTIKDSEGNQIYFETEDGSWYRKEFDSNGNETYFKDSTGYEVTFKPSEDSKSITGYDPEGNIVSYQDDTGICIRNEFVGFWMNKSITCPKCSVSYS